MNSISYPAVLRAYFKRHIKALMVLCVFALIFIVVFSLYKLPIDAVIYALILCAFFGIVFILFESTRYYNRHKEMCAIMRDIVSVGVDMPIVHDLIEQDYLDIINILQSQNRKNASQYDLSLRDMIDYYTMWVHQIKTPIAAMDLLLQSSDSAQKAELGAELFKIERYAEMVLGYLKIDSISGDLMLKKYNLDDIVRQAIRKYSKLFIAKKITLEYAELGISVLTDEKWLLLVIEQLLSNALKYTNSGKISIYMKPQCQCTLAICDEGIGIAAEDIPRVFEKGFTGFNGRVNKQSTGIGLYLCKKILDKLSHKITIESQEGCGTCVLIDMSMVALETE